MIENDIENIRVLENHEIPRKMQLSGSVSFPIRPIWYWKIKKYATIAKAKSRFLREVVGIEEETTSSKSK